MGCASSWTARRLSTQWHDQGETNYERAALAHRGQAGRRGHGRVLPTDRRRRGARRDQRLHSGRAWSASCLQGSRGGRRRGRRLRGLQSAQGKRGRGPALGASGGAGRDAQAPRRPEQARDRRPERGRGRGDEGVDRRRGGLHPRGIPRRRGQPGPRRDPLRQGRAPRGKLPTSFPAEIAGTYYADAYPPVDHRQVYREGIFMGYRWFDEKNVAPLYPFGYGLTYSTFKLALKHLPRRRPPAARRRRVQVTGEEHRTHGRRRDGAALRRAARRHRPPRAARAPGLPAGSS